MDIRNIFNERRDQYNALLESTEVVTELFGKRKKEKIQKRNEKLINDLLNDKLAINESDVDIYEKDYQDLINFISKLIKKEIPGADIRDVEVKPSRREINDDYTLITYNQLIFTMTDDNYKKYVSKSKNENLKNSEEPYEYVEELVEDNKNRFMIPVEKHGFSFNEETGLYAKKKNGKEYLYVDFGDEAAFSLNVMMSLLVKK